MAKKQLSMFFNQNISSEVYLDWVGGHLVMVPIPGRQFAFIVRIRLEPDSTDQHNEPILRGMLQPIGSKTVRYFSSLEDIPRVVEEFTGTVQRKP
jgi:hypothetical protein